MGFVSAAATLGFPVEASELCEFKKTVSSMKRRDMLVRLRGN